MKGSNVILVVVVVGVCIAKGPDAWRFVSGRLPPKQGEAAVSPQKAATAEAVSSLTVQESDALRLAKDVKDMVRRQYWDEMTRIDDERGEDDAQSAVRIRSNYAQTAADSARSLRQTREAFEKQLEASFWMNCRLSAWEASQPSGGRVSLNMKFAGIREYSVDGGMQAVDAERIVRVSCIQQFGEWAVEDVRVQQ